jgi:hypothetical protein
MKISLWKKDYSIAVLIRFPQSHMKSQKPLPRSNTPETATTVTLRSQNPNISNDALKYLSKFEAIFKTALACDSGAQENRLMEKKPRIEISCLCPFK